ncbi:MAG: tetratricopeptide repeat protein [Alphaproteobacteria bacterium]|nr:tetratricopeptide repeat protein [Alphaproteobacteria bacterium]
MILSGVFSGLSLIVAGVVAPGNVAQDALDKLAAAGSEAEAANLEEEVWDAWMFSGSPTVDILMKRGVEAQDAEDLDLARDMFDRAIMIRPDYAEGWNRRALLFFNAGKYDEAIADLETTLKYEPRHFGAWIGLAMIFESMSQGNAALQAYRKALVVHPFAAAAKEGQKRLIPQVEGRTY